MITIKVIAAITILFALHFAASASEQDKIDAGQTPPVETPQEPKADSKPAEKVCVTDDSKFRQDGKKNTFVVALKNSCAQPQRCKVNVYVVGSTGPVQGSGTVTLGAAANGQYSQKSYVLKVKEAGGMANMSRSCKAI